MASVTLVRNARIYPSPHPASALVMIDDRIGYLGSIDQARGLAISAREVDLGGRLLTPAFVDAHLHVIQTGQLISGLDLHGARSRDQVLQRLASYAARHPNRRVIVGQGWDERHWPDPRPPTRSELDRAAAGIAVYLARVDVHSAVVSTALLDQLREIAALEGYRTDGLLARQAHHLVRGRMDRLFSDGERRADAAAALSRSAAAGIGTVHDMVGPHLGPIEDLPRVREAAAEQGIEVISYWAELATPETLAKARSVGAAGLAGDLCVDGALGSRTAALIEPYVDQAEGSKDRGVRYLSDAEITNHIIECTAAGVQAGFHCIGDEAVVAAVQGFHKAASRVGVAALRQNRHRLEHLEMAGNAEIASLAEYGVVASMQPAFDALWGGPGELYEQRLGASRAAAMNRCGSLHRAGVQLAFGTDSPVTPIAGWETVRAAVRHRQPHERLSVAEALAAATVGGHRAGRVDDAGLLLPGWRANFAIWEGDVGSAAAANGLPGIDADEALPACWATVVAGRQIYGPDDSGLPRYEGPGRSCVRR
jgi:predicted amidohydrolase YtcJ